MYLTLLEAAENGNHLPMPAWAFGLIAIVILLMMFSVVIGFGGSRPHS